MNKQEFLGELRSRLSGLPSQEVEERLNFYSEMIDDGIEEGMSEEDAIAQIGSVEKVAAQIVSDIPLSKIVKDRIKPKRKIKAWEIVLIALGSPIWFSLAISLLAVIFSLYVSLWAVVVSLWSVFAAFVAGGALGIFSGVGIIIGGKALTGVGLIGAGLVLTGLSVFAFYGCRAVTKYIVLLTAKMAVGTKNCFIKREGA